MLPDVFTLHLHQHVKGRPDLCCAKYASAGERPNATQLTAIYKSWGEEERVQSSPTQLGLHALAACPAEAAALHSCRSESAAGLPPPPLPPQRETAGFNIACGTRVHFASLNIRSQWGSSRRRSFWWGEACFQQLLCFHTEGVWSPQRCLFPSG